MIVFLVNDTADKQHSKCIKSTKTVKSQSWNGSFNRNQTEVLDVAIDRIAEEHLLHCGREPVQRIEDSRQVHQEQREYIIQITDIPEKNKQCGKNQAHTDIKYHQAYNGV